MNSCFKGDFKVTSPYGERLLNGKKEFHSGIDLVGVEDVNVYAPCDAIVIASNIVTDKNNRTWEWGNYVCLASLDGMYHIYLCHLALRSVMRGQKVKKGDKIGVMGNTGYSFGAHTHFEVRDAKTNKRINAAEFIGIPNKEGVYDGADEFDEALTLLNGEGVIDTPEYWALVVNGKKPINLQYLKKLICNFARRLKR